MYTPRPLDTSHVELPDTIVQLTERLAENNHDLWAQQRFSEGWTHGPKRDDTRRQHPDLVDYSTLPESEKAYDRITAMHTLKMILALGYRIEGPVSASAPASDTPTSDAAVALQRLRDPTLLDLTALLALSKASSPAWWNSTPELAQRLGERVLKVSEPVLAYDILAAGLEHWPRDVRLRQLLALALARSGAPERANSILRQLYREGHRDGETLGILARTHRDLWMLAVDPADRTRELQQAHDLYAQGYRLAVRRGRLDDAIYNGINAATTPMLLGRGENARPMARKVRVLCQTKLQAGQDYWAQASLGEAALLLGNYTEAEDGYAKVAALGHGNFADLSTTRRTARWLAEVLCGDTHRFDHCFGIPRIVVFAGHMVDQPERPSPRFPPQLEKAVYRAIAKRLQALHAGIGYASAACDYVGQVPLAKAYGTFPTYHVRRVAG